MRDDLKPNIPGTRAIPKVLLTDALNRGELTMGICGLLSTVSTTILFLWITYKLAWGKRVTQSQHRSLVEDPWGMMPSPSHPVPQPLDANDSMRPYERTARPFRDPHIGWDGEDNPEPNSFLILIYHLLLGDINQSVAFVFSLYWYKEHAVLGSAACWAQGWLISSGRLATACFFALISLHTFSVIVLGRTPGRLVLYLSIICVWAFTYLLTAAGIIITWNDKDSEGWYIPLSAWCWVSDDYGRLRFWTGYFWIFLSVALTTFLYILIFVSLYLRRQWLVGTIGGSHQRRQRQSRYMRHRGNNRHAPPRPTGHHPVFLVYPFLYLVCTLPVSTVRLLADAGYNVGQQANIMAGVLVALHGGLNVLLWTLMLVYLPPDQLDDCGLGGFMRTPAGREYGNMVWIRGPSSPSSPEGLGLEPQQHPQHMEWPGWLCQTKKLCSPRAMLQTPHNFRQGSSPASLRRASRSIDVRPVPSTSRVIQIDTVTTVTGEARHEGQPG